MGRVPSLKYIWRALVELDPVVALAATIRLGYEVEADDPNIGFETPSEDEVAWLAAWIVSEGWCRGPVDVTDAG